MSIVEKYNQEKGCTIQYDISELLQTDLSDALKSRLMKFDIPDVAKFIALFQIQSKTKISTIKGSLNCLKEVLPENLFEETKDEVKDICDDYKWINSKDGKLILQIEEWIKEARGCLSVDFPFEYIYIGRSFVEPVSLIVGGYVKESSFKNFIESYFSKMNPPITIEYKINIYETDR